MQSKEEQYWRDQPTDIIWLNKYGNRDTDTNCIIDGNMREASKFGNFKNTTEKLRNTIMEVHTQEISGQNRGLQGNRYASA